VSLISNTVSLMWILILGGGGKGRTGFVLLLCVVQISGKEGKRKEKQASSSREKKTDEATGDQIDRINSDLSVCVCNNVFYNDETSLPHKSILHAAVR